MYACLSACLPARPPVCLFACLFAYEPDCLFGHRFEILPSPLQLRKRSRASLRNPVESAFGEKRTKKPSNDFHNDEKTVTRALAYSRHQTIACIQCLKETRASTDRPSDRAGGRTGDQRTNPQTHRAIDRTSERTVLQELEETAFKKIETSQRPSD